MENQNTTLKKITLYLLFLILLIYGLKAGRDFLYPLVLAILLSFLFYPLAHFLERKVSFPRIVANLVCVLIFVFGSYFFIRFLIHQFSPVMGDITEVRQKFNFFFERILGFFQSEFGVTPHQQDQIKDQLKNVITSGGETVRTAFTATIGTIGKFILLPIYMFFFLYYRDKYRSFIFQMAQKKNVKNSESIVDEVSVVVRKYMTGIFKVVVTLMFLNTLGLFIIGHPNFLLLGILSALCNFIPFLGTWIGGGMVLLFTLFTSFDLQLALSVIILFLIINFIENNLLTPNIIGGYVAINPFFILLSIIVGGMIWGVPGMIIIVPFVSIFKILCDHVEKLQPVAFLLSPRGTEKHALTWDKIKEFGKKIFRK